jgi:hypothetical protein
MRENAPSNCASIVASLLKCVTSLLTRSRDPSPLLRHPSIYSVSRQRTRRVATRHDTAELCSARRKHRFVYCCVIAGTCFNVTILPWRTYFTIYSYYALSDLRFAPPHEFLVFVKSCRFFSSATLLFNLSNKPITDIYENIDLGQQIHKKIRLKWLIRM